MLGHCQHSEIIPIIYLFMKKRSYKSYDTDVHVHIMSEQLLI